MAIDSGWLQASGVSRMVSPYCDDRPDPNDISLLVIHNISLPAGVFTGGHVCDLFMGQLDCGQHASFSSLVGMCVSAHIFIRRDGRITQFVPFHRRAWHAGDSSFQGRSACNDYAVGIELEGTDTWVYTYQQYEQLLRVVGWLRGVYPAITSDRIVGHSDIAPGRKTDPGLAFDWSYFRRKLEAQVGV